MAFIYKIWSYLLLSIYSIYYCEWVDELILHCKFHCDYHKMTIKALKNCKYLIGLWDILYTQFNNTYGGPEVQNTTANQEIMNTNQKPPTQISNHQRKSKKHNRKSKKHKCKSENTNENRKIWTQIRNHQRKSKKHDCKWENTKANRKGRSRFLICFLGLWFAFVFFDLRLCFLIFCCVLHFRATVATVSFCNIFHWLFLSFGAPDYLQETLQK